MDALAQQLHASLTLAGAQLQRVRRHRSRARRLGSKWDVACNGQLQNVAPVVQVLVAQHLPGSCAFFLFAILQVMLPQNLPCARVSSSAAYSQNALSRTLRTDAKAGVQTSGPEVLVRAPRRGRGGSRSGGCRRGPAAEVEGRKYPPFAAFRIHGTGRRKTAVARVGLIEGDGNIIVNSLSLSDYFQDQALLIQVGSEGVQRSILEHRRFLPFGTKALVCETEETAATFAYPGLVLDGIEASSYRRHESGGGLKGADRFRRGQVALLST